MTFAIIVLQMSFIYVRIIKNSTVMNKCSVGMFFMDLPSVTCQYFCLFLDMFQILHAMMLITVISSSLFLKCEIMLR
jgi:hypothetical protein